MRTKRSELLSQPIVMRSVADAVHVGRAAQRFVLVTQRQGLSNQPSVRCE